MSDREKVLLLAGVLAKVVQGLQNGSVRADPMLDLSDQQAKNYPIISLEQVIAQALGECGIILTHSLNRS